MPDCYAKNCKSRRSIKRQNKKQIEWEQQHRQKISFHKIPQEIDKRDIWLLRLGLDQSKVPKIASICSLHFKEENLDRTSLSCTRLRPDATPDAIPNIQFMKENSNMKGDKLLLKQKKMNRHLIEIADHNYAIQDHMNFHEVAEKRNVTSNAFNIKGIDVGTQTTSHSSKFSNRETATSSYLSDNTPRKLMLRTVLFNTKEAYKKKIKIIQQKQRRNAKYVAKLKIVLTALKKKNLLDA